AQQGPMILGLEGEGRSLATALGDAQIFPIIETTWTDAPHAVEQLQPAAVVVAMSANVEPGFEPLAKQIAARQPYLPLIAIDPGIMLPENALPFSQVGDNFDRLTARLRAALR